MLRKDIYELLGLSRKASAKAVAKSFRRFARMNHPDLFPGDKEKEDRFKRVTAEYHNWKLIQGTLKEMQKLKIRSGDQSYAPTSPLQYSKQNRFSWVA